MTMWEIAFTVNGERVDGRAEARKTLADFLREDAGLTGTKLGCEHGVCGACTVLVDGAAVRSCLLFAVQARDADILTVEGLGAPGGLHPIQEAFSENHGLQCGFCTPGFLISTYALLEERPDPSEEEIRSALSGGICRCTGYQGIVESVLAAAAKRRAAPGARA